jgi:hypothetical protein
VISDVLNGLSLSLPKIRLEAYRPEDANDLEMITNYFWDIALAEALLPVLHGVELSLRNSLHHHLSIRYDNSMWFYILGVLEPGQLGQLSGALSQLAARKTQPTDGHIVAELTFGFWVTLISDPYQRRLWQPDGYALLKDVFPQARNISRQNIHRRYNLIRRDIRNRVFHHEAVWDRPNLLQEYHGILDAIRWISPPLKQALSGMDRFADVYAHRDRFQQDLRDHLGM